MPETNKSAVYEPPAIVVAGTLHADTLRNKAFGKPNDGDYISRISETTVSS